MCKCINMHGLSGRGRPLPLPRTGAMMEPTAPMSVSLHPDERRIDGHCGICPSGCAVHITIRAGRIVRVTPDPGRQNGQCCRRVGRAPDILYSPDRLLHPLARLGERGENTFHEIGWEEALDTIASRLQETGSRFGPEAACLYTGRGTFERSLWEMLSPAGVRETCAWSLLFPFGSPNTTGAGSMCYVSHAVIAPATTFGFWGADTQPDLEHANLIVVWGTNPANASPPDQMTAILKARKRGAAVIVIDHRRTETAVKAHAQWIPVRPGTDGALALSMINVLIEEALLDQSFANEWTVGFNGLRELARRFTPETTESVTGVAPAVVRQATRDIARSGGASLLSYTGLEYSNSAVQAIRAVMILWALSGNLDVRGGNLIQAHGSGFAVNAAHRIEPPGQPAPVGASVYPLYHRFRREAQAMELPRAILHDDPYPVRSLLIFGASIITGYPNPALWRKAFSALDFLLVVDRFPTEDSRYADIILPAASAFEYDSYLLFDNVVKLRRKVIEPVGESRSDWDIVAGIANRLGYGHLFPRSNEEMLQWAFEDTGVDLAELQRSPEGVALPAVPREYRKWEIGRLRPDGKPGFPTPSGKCEIASSVLAEYGYDPLPVFTAPKEGPSANPTLASRFPLIFNSGARSGVFFCSQHHNVPSLARQRPHPLVWINTEDAAERGIASGDPVEVESPRGSVRYEAFVTDNIVKGSVEADAGGGAPGSPEAWRSCNVNELTDSENRDPLSGFPVYKALLCEVRRITA